MAHDPYHSFAKRYDVMHRKNPEREDFFCDLFARNDIVRVLDCACGTGRDLILFSTFGLEVVGSDLSAAMLTQARCNLDSAGLSVPLYQLDFRKLPSAPSKPFDAVVCLSNSINELLDDNEVVRALRSMRAVLKPGGLLVIDQGQTEAMMQHPPRVVPILNERDLTRVFVMDYDRDIMTVGVLDFLHTDQVSKLEEHTVRIRIRLHEAWQLLLDQAGFESINFIGGWDGTPYGAESTRLILTATKPE